MSDSRRKTSCIKKTAYYGEKIVWKDHQTDTDKLILVVYRYQNNKGLKGSEMEPRTTEWEMPIFKRIYPLNIIDVYFKRCNVLHETHFIPGTIIFNDGCFFFRGASSHSSRQ